MYDSNNAGTFTGAGTIMVVNEELYLHNRVAEEREINAYTLDYTDEQEQFLKATFESCSAT